MRHRRFRIFLVLIIFPAFSSTIVAQSWDFIKEKDGIKIYPQSGTGWKKNKPGALFPGTVKKARPSRQII